VADVAAEIAKLERGFELEASEATADKIVELRRKREKAELFAQRTLGLVEQARIALTEVEASINAAKIAELRAKIDGTTGRVETVVDDKILPLVRELSSALEKLRGEVDGGIDAALQLRGLTGQIVSSEIQALRSLELLPAVRLKASAYAEFERVERVFR
jgi:hypothetical protein